MEKDFRERSPMRELLVCLSSHLWRSRISRSLVSLAPIGGTGLSMSSEEREENGAERLEVDERLLHDGNVSDEFRDEHGEAAYGGVEVALALDVDVASGGPIGTSLLRFDSRNLVRLQPELSSKFELLSLLRRNVPCWNGEFFTWPLLTTLLKKKRGALLLLLLMLPLLLKLDSSMEVVVIVLVVAVDDVAFPWSDAIWNSLSESLRISSARFTQPATSLLCRTMQELSEARRSNCNRSE